MHLSGPPNRSGRFNWNIGTEHLCDINTARMKYDYALGSVVPQPLKECISLELLKK